MMALAATLVVWDGSRTARAAPCCMSATAFGIGRLLIWEDFAVGLRTSIAPGIGAWDADGRWRSWASDYDETEWRSEVWGLVGIDRRASVFARVPGVVLARWAGDASDVGGGIGDVSAGLRYEIVGIGEYLELPAIALTLAVLAPTGRAPEESETDLAVDVTGRGAWVLSAGLSLEHTQLPWFVRLDVGASVPLPQARDDLGVDQRLGVSVDVALSGGFEVHDGIVLSLVPRLTWTDRTRLDEEPVAGSSRLDVGVAVTGSFRLDPHWTTQLSFDAPMAIDGLGRNQPGRLLTTLGLRYGSF